MRVIWLLMGLLMVALGVVGALLPLMPTTIFLILAVGCFARSSPRLESWLLNHPRWGHPLTQWREQGAISRKGKVFAASGMGFGFCVFAWQASPSWWLALIVATALLACAAWILTRPEPS